MGHGWGCVGPGTGSGRVHKTALLVLCRLIAGWAGKLNLRWLLGHDLNVCPLSDEPDEQAFLQYTSRPIARPHEQGPDQNRIKTPSEANKRLRDSVLGRWPNLLKRKKNVQSQWVK